MSKKWSFRSKTKSTGPKTFWNNRVTRAIVSRTVSLRRNKLNESYIGRPRRILTARRRFPLRIPITSLSISDHLDNEENVVVLCEPSNHNIIVKDESYEKIWPALSNIENNMILPSNLIPSNMRLVNVNHFLNFRRDFIFSINAAEKIMPLLAVLDGIAAIKVDKTKPQVFGNFLEFTDNLSKGSLSNDSIKPLLSPLESISSTKIEESQTRFFADFYEYIESLNKESQKCEEIKELCADLANLSQVVVGESDSIKLGEFFAGIAELEDQANSKTYIVPLLASMENISRIAFKESNSYLIGELFNGNDNNEVNRNSVTLLPLFDSLEQITTITQNKSNTNVNSAVSCENQKKESNLFEGIFNDPTKNTSDKQIQELKPILSAIESITASQVKASITSMVGEFFKYISEINDKQNKHQEHNLKLASSSLENVVSRMQQSLTNFSSMDVGYNTCSGQTDPKTIETPLAPMRHRAPCPSATSICSCTNNVFMCPPVQSKEPLSDAQFYAMEENTILQRINELEIQITSMTVLQKRLKIYYEFLKQHQSSI
uniref:Enhancer of mRNA-decapping protein 4 n=1 Tax=Strongyloides venezuelensis TaxID=75913 RepID=A0A0K0FL95_STRVS